MNLFYYLLKYFFILTVFCTVGNMKKCKDDESKEITDKQKCTENDQCFYLRQDKKCYEKGNYFFNTYRVM